MSIEDKSFAKTLLNAFKEEWKESNTFLKKAFLIIWFPFVIAFFIFFGIVWGIPQLIWIYIGDPTWKYIGSRINPKIKAWIEYHFWERLGITFIAIVFIGGFFVMMFWSAEDTYQRKAEYQVNSICIKKYPPPFYMVDMNYEFRNKYIGDELVESIPIKDSEKYHHDYDEAINRWERENWECPDPNTDSYPKPDYFYANARNFIVGIFK